MTPAPKLIGLLLFLVYLGLAGQSQAAERPDRVLSPYFHVEGGDPDLDGLPLKETRASVRIAGVIARVQITQVYRNEGERAIEAVYIFPGSTRAAVTGMEMDVGEHTIVAKIKTRDAAKRIYEEASKSGKTASLLEQERPNVFQMKVANIMPGEQVTVRLDYVEALVPEEGVYEFVYPTVVGPRFSEKRASSSPEETWIENPHGRAGQDPRYSWDIDATIQSGVDIRDLQSPSHALETRFASATEAHIGVDDVAGGNRDFVLRYRLTGDALQTGLMLFPGADENFFLAMVQPPKRVVTTDLPPREYIFIVDVSGSMGGFPMQTTRSLMKKIFGTLRPQDRLNLMLFSGGSTVLAEESLPATKQNIARANAALERASGGGSTQILGALRRALAMKRSSDISTSFVVVTDGYVSVEDETFSLIRSSLNSANLFAFGIGSSVNRHLIEGLARSGMGESFVALGEEDARRQAKAFARYISQPVLTDVHLDFEGFAAYDVVPTSVPDVFAERPVVVFGKYRGEATGSMILRGRDGSGPKRSVVDIGSEAKASPRNQALRYLWARHRIGELEDDAQLGKKSVKRAIRKLGLTYGLMTAHTSFVAVDPRVRNAKGPSSRVRQVLPMPAGVPNSAIGSYGSIGHGSIGYGSIGHGSGGGGYGYGIGVGYGKSSGVSGVRGRVARAAPAVRVGQVMVTGSLDKNVVRRHIRLKLARLRYCYEKELLKEPGLAGTITLEIRIDPSGRVAEASATGMGNAAVESCVAAVARSIRFPNAKGGGSVSVRYPLRFRPDASSTP